MREVARPHLGREAGGEGEELQSLSHLSSRAHERSRASTWERGRWRGRGTAVIHTCQVEPMREVARPLGERQVERERNCSHSHLSSRAHERSRASIGREAGGEGEELQSFTPVK